MPWVNVLLIVANVAVFFYQTQLGAFGLRLFVSQYAIVPGRLTEGAILPWGWPEGEVPAALTLVTSMFLHGGLAHLIGNLWFLWIFGDNIEEFFGHLGYLFFYLLTGVAAGLCHIALNSDSWVPTLGASGAVSGVLGAYFVLFPRIRVRTLVVLGFFIEILAVPAAFFLGLWFLLQLIGGWHGGQAIAFGAHIGGFVAGVLMTLTLSRRAGPARYRYEPHRQRRW